MTAAERELGYRPVVSYADSLAPTVKWLSGRLAGREWREAFPGLAKYQVDFFDYAAEDAWLASPT